MTNDLKSKAIADIMIGCDPELFVRNTKTMRFVSAHDLIPGDKLDPYDVPFGAIQRDGTAAEFNIKPAAKRSDFLHHVQHVSNILSNAIKNVNGDYELVAQPTVHFEPEYFKELPTEALMLGCDPDYNAYTGEVNEKPNATGSTMRTGSGHIHIQFLPKGVFVKDRFEKSHMLRCCSLVKALDAVLYEQSLMWDTDKERHKLYGKPGAFRPKNFGVEYRVLSNAWLREPWVQMFIFDAAYNTTRRWLEGWDAGEEVHKLRMKTSRFKDYLDLLDGHGIPSIRSYAPEGFLEHSIND